MPEAAEAAYERGRRVADHYEPCGALRVAETEITNVKLDISDNVKADISLLFKRVDRLPTWAVFYISAITGCLGAAVTAVYFLANRL